MKFEKQVMEAKKKKLESRIIRDVVFIILGVIFLIISIIGAINNDKKEGSNNKAVKTVEKN